MEFSNSSILSEEETSDEEKIVNEVCFIVDPIDGTKEFIGGNGQFTVNIALAIDGRPVVGVVYAPALKKLYYASKGEGSYVEDLSSNAKKKIVVSNRTDKLVWIGNRFHSGEKEDLLNMKNSATINKIVSAGSSLKGCLIAEGIADVYYRFGLTREWDIAAMECIFEEAGGILRQMDGGEMTYNRKNTLNEKGFYVVNREENIWV